LEDEMELKAGELVRLLHEYDDGWVSSTTKLPFLLLRRTDAFIVTVYQIG
jgi:hypothetical protein